ncbi:MAG TPA: Mrp/NBP35 family ATP-binding protein [Candidatus Xenobia bacterium]|nr:Mrp/NBP35 family ATP-binding protein [Candidatus Xenobia bacterium]
MGIFGNKKLTQEQVLDALRTVMEPELHRDIVTLNMIKDLAVDDGRVWVTINLTTPACPLKDTIEKDVRAALAKLDGFKDVTIKWGATVPQGRPLNQRGGIPGVKNIIAVASGKGGVGKTTVAVNLAIALARMGASVGLLDADVYGPNVPTMLGATEQPYAEGDRIIPIQAHGVKMISMGLLNPEKKPLIWRGPMLHQVLQQFLRQVGWGELDYLIIDLPPGTGDVQLSLIQTVAVTGAVVVTTPSIVALDDVHKAIEMFRQVKVEILGVAENMSYFLCPHCGARTEVFSYGEGKNTAQKFGVPFLGEIPLDPGVRLHGDTGKPSASLGEETPEAAPFYSLARQVAAALSVIALREPTAPVIQIE